MQCSTDAVQCSALLLELQCQDLRGEKEAQEQAQTEKEAQEQARAEKEGDVVAGAKLKRSGSECYEDLQEDYGIDQLM
eukprot:8703505-Heterocapsa_arctica.AAC.1